MDQVALQAFDESTRTALFRAFEIDPGQLTDLGGFESFVFARRDKDSILRVTHRSHRNLDQVLAELDWIDFLARRGAAVCTPLSQGGGELARAWGDFIVCEFSRARGHTVTEADWGPPLFAEWGRSIARFHELSRHYLPPAGRPCRPDCAEDENFDLEGLVPAGQPAVSAMARQYRDRFMVQPRTADSFGLVHSDPHAGNFFTEDGRLTFFDFDDACYCWFSYDVATILLSAVMQPWLEDSQAGREEAARQFLPAFLEGYASVREVTPSLTEQLPLGLKFREICLYGVISRFLPPEDRDWYASRFMGDGRRERIESDEPYLALDFL